MILRKPYAFFIKHFRLLHFILSFLILYCIYYSKKLLDFFNEYTIETINLKGQELVSIYTPKLYQLMPFLIIILLSIILVVLIIKKKPIILYIINIASCIFTIIAIQVAKGTLNTLQYSILDIRTVRLIRDIVMLSFIIQAICAIIVLIRSIGFDVKKFDFKQDLKELEISESDREEFELEFKIDRNKTKRTIRRRIRFLKYSYKENKLLVHIITAFCICLIIIGGLSYTKKDKTLSENIYMTYNGVTLKINKSYITSTDYKGNIIDENSIFIILKANIKVNKNKDILDISTTKLSVGNYSYIPTYDYIDAFHDFGNVYLGDNLSNEYQEKILVYKIPKQLKDETIQFHYVNKVNTDKKIVKLNIKDLNSKSNEIKQNIGQELDFSDSILSTYKIKINSFDIQKKYKLSYDFCYNKECFESYEYIVPTINTNIDKAILKLEGTLTTEKVVSKLNNLYDIINAFAVIEYSVDGNIKTSNIELKEAISTKNKEENIFYIEVPSDLQNAESMLIKFNIRNKIYKYVLK